MSDTPVSATPRPMDGLKSQAMTYWKQAAPLARPAVSFAARRPRLWMGLGALGLIGMVAWMNRKRIARTAGPMVDAAMEKGGALYGKMPWAKGAETPEAPGGAPPVH